MCGIAGKINFNKAAVRREEIDVMLNTMKYRGPNSRGAFFDDGVGFGHLRLSILDLSAAGHQPMENGDGSLTIVYNGEIYNYIEIRGALKQKGHVFKTGTDTEVILAAYKEWGEDCVKKFNGMWAFAIFDKTSRKIFISRDRFGVKPVFYYADENFFAFGSEIKSLLALGVKKEINRKFLYNFIAREISYGDNETVFDGIKFLPPAHSLIIELDKKSEIQIKRHWQFLPDEFENKYDYSNPIKVFRELLIDAVKLRLRSDVPVGVCLSGGIDSSVIVCIIAKLFGQKIDTFSSVYDMAGYGEKEFADAVNKECDTSSSYIYPGPDSFFEILENLIKHHDKPVRMPGTYSQWHVFKCAARKVIVTLDGQGADELLAGYDYYTPHYLADLAKSFTKISFDKSVLKVFFPWLLNPKHIFVKRENWQDQILSDMFICEHGGAKIKKAPKIFGSYLNQELFRTFVTTNLPMLLDNEDRISMAFSLESRVPFLDYRLVEFSFGLNYDMKIKDGCRKYILREAFKDILPEKIYNRKDKKGFPTPIEHWFRGELKRDLEKIFSSKDFGFGGILDAEKVRKIFKEHLAGEDRSRILWRALTVYFWLKEYFI